MKLNFNKDDTTKAVYAFLVAAAALIFYFILKHMPEIWSATKMIVSLLMPFIYAFCIAYLLNPLMKCFEKLYKKIFGLKGEKVKRPASLILTYLTATLFIVFFIWVITPQIKDSIQTIAIKLTTWTPQAMQKLLDFTRGIELTEEMYSNLQNFLAGIGNKILGISKDSLSGIWGSVLNITAFLYNFLFGIIISIYMLADKEVFSRQAKKAVKVIFRKKSAKIIDTFSTANEIFKGFFVGKLLDSLIMAALCVVLMSIFRLPYVALVSFIFGITNIIPYFGPIVGAVIGTLIILIDSPVKALWFLILAIVLQQLDGNVIGPKILSNSTGISAFWVIFAIVIFGGLFGFVGMLAGVPAFALIYALLKAFFDKKTEEN